MSIRRFGPTAIVLFALVVQYYFHEMIGDKAFLLLYPAVFLGAFVGSLRAQLVAIKIGTVGAWYIFIPPQFSFELNDIGAAFGLLVFFATSAGVCIFSHRFQRSRLARENILKDIIEIIPQGIWRTTPDGAANFFSERFYSLVGYTQKEFLGWGWSDVIHPDDKPLVIEEWKRCRDNRIPVNIDFRVLKKDGSYRWFKSLGNPSFNETGELESYYGTWTDIHAEKLGLAEIKMKSEAIENSLNGFDIVNGNGQIIYANRAYLKMWGFDSLDEIIGTSPASHCLDPEIPIKIITALKQTGECNIEFTAKRKDGSTFEVNMFARFALDQNGQEIYPTTSIDITEQKRAHRALLEAKEVAEKANILKSAFLANMSHEIRTPLGAMIGFAELLQDSKTSESDRNKYLSILTRNGHQLAHIINDILDLSKVEAGFLALEFSKTQLEKAITEVVSLLSVQAQEKGISFKIGIEPNTPQFIVTDPFRLKQILSNILGNSIKFTRAGEIDIHVFARLKDTIEFINIEVKDTGIGIPADQLDQVFQMFVQADGSMTRRFGGTGLGLSLSKKLAQSLGGDVTITKTEINVGSTFLVTVRNELDEEKPTLFTEWSDAKNKSLGSENMLAGIKVLLVEDTPDNQFLISHHLIKQGAKVGFAANGEEGVDAAIKGNFDVVLMDIQMPVMDGYAATALLREKGYKRPIIALTAHAMSEVRNKCISIGCNDHLTKPLKAKELVETVAHFAQSSGD